LHQFRGKSGSSITSGDHCDFLHKREA
jgi:hypothetical protein